MAWPQLPERTNSNIEHNTSGTALLLPNTPPLHPIINMGANTASSRQEMQSPAEGVELP